jgi:signal transduction histidine kinase
VQDDPETSAAPAPAPGSLQWAFWLASVTVLDTLRAASGELRGVADLVVPSVVWVAVGYGVSSVLLRLGRRLGVVERPLPVMSAFAVAGVVVATLATTAAIGSIGLLLGGAPPRLRDMAGLVLVIATVFALWSAAALLVAQMRRAHDAERRVLVAQSLASEARLRMLRHQLNPHFLFNSLNSLAATIDEDRDRAQRLVLDLSSLLRDALADDSDDGTLGDELDRVERYLRIERSRFEDRLQLHASVAEELRAAPCLPLLLQPLVENAIKHGASGAAAEVQLTASREGGRVRIRISNPLSKESVPGAGVGLANVRERLAVRYGSEHRLEQRQRPDGWMDVELSWPCERRR